MLNKHNTYKLPIEYVNPKYLFTIDKILDNDLELSNLNSISINENEKNNEKNKNMYNYLIQPTNQLSNNLINNLWNKYYTNDTNYLIDTQNVICNMNMYNEKIKKNKYTLNYDKLNNIWNNLKEDKNFLIKYNYVDWKILESLNNSSCYLQTTTITNLLSPILSLILPIIILLIPFIFLKIEGIPININSYFDNLKHISKKHFFINSLISFNKNNIHSYIYLLFSLLLYLFTIYNNFNYCNRFYNNIKRINDELNELKNYINYSIDSMNIFQNINNDKINYKSYLKDVNNNITILKNISNDLKDINNNFNINNFGYILKTYYSLYSNINYENSLLYSIHFEGYINILNGIYNNVQNKKINKATFNNNNKLLIVKQYYPSLLNNKNIVKNNCNLNKNIIITGANACGKTTFIKTSTLNIIFSQQIGFGFYDKCFIHPYDYIHSYINILDSSTNKSLFELESLRCKNILDKIENTDKNIRHFCIIDELFSGTNYIESTNTSYAFLKYLQQFKNVNYILTTHCYDMCIKLKHTKHNILFLKMEVILKNNNFIYTYKIKKGISKIHGAIAILKKIKMSNNVINIITNNL